VQITAYCKAFDAIIYENMSPFHTDTDTDIY